MPLAVAYEDVKANRVALGSNLQGRKGSALVTPFIGSRDNPDLPLANLGQRVGASYNGPHFHVVDQFQVVIAGAGRIGRHDLEPYGIHFSRAYTPYGPLISHDAGLTYFVLRAHPDTDSQRLPQEREQLKRAKRAPWQVTRLATFPPPSADVVLRRVAGIQDDRGLAAFTLTMPPHATTTAPDASRSDGQFVVVLNGSLLHAGREYKAWALCYAFSNEGAYAIQAGSCGLEALVLNFPLPYAAGATAPPTVPRGSLKTWRCALCSFVYDEAAGMPEEGIAAGTRWQDVPDTWSCPDCSASKSDFQMVEMSR